MTIREERVNLALAKLAESAQDINEAVAAHHKAFVAAIKSGATDSQLSATLGVSRQAIQQYRKRWLSGGRPSRSTAPTLFD